MSVHANRHFTDLLIFLSKSEPGREVPITPGFILLKKLFLRPSTNFQLISHHACRAPRSYHPLNRRARMRVRELLLSRAHPW